MTDIEYAHAYERLRQLRRQRATAEINGDFARAQRLKGEVDGLSRATAESMRAMLAPPRDSLGRFVSRSALP